LPEHRIKLYATHREVLQTDILSFYHTIYTHSIPWALHGKAVAKQNRSRHDPAVFGNALDFYVRQGQDGQTKGIPVGPDTSRIISEIILCAIEEILEQRAGARIPAGFRYIDDIFLCFGSGASASDALSALRIAVQEFELQLNDAKTAIHPALEYNEETWPGVVSSRRIAAGGRDQRRSLLRFFGAVIDASKKTQTESIANYAIKLTTRVLIQRRNWDIYEAFLIRIARESTNTVDIVVKIFCTYASMGYALTDLVTQFIDTMVLEHSPLNHHYEVAWILWLAFSLGIRLTRAATEALCRIQNCFCALLALQLADRGLLDGPFDVSSWLSISGPDFYGTHWLLIYEGAVHGWLGAPARNVVSADPFFSALMNEGISFFDQNVPNRPLKVAESEFLLQRRLGGRRSGRLPGNVFVQVRQGEPVEDDFEVLGDEYGFDEFADDFPDFDDEDDGA
jgi:hypothetical protein